MKGKLFKKLTAASLCLALAAAAVPQELSSVGLSGDYTLKASADETDTTPAQYYNLCPQSADGGYIRIRSEDGTTDRMTAQAGETLTIAAIPNEGYQFIGIDGYYRNPSDPMKNTIDIEMIEPITVDEYTITHSFTMPAADAYITPAFSKIKTYTVSLGACEHGTIKILDEESSIAVDSSTADENDTVTIDTEPDFGYRLSKLSYYYYPSEEETTKTECVIYPAETSETEEEDDPYVIKNTGKFEFTMPAYNVTVEAEFEKIPDVKNGDEIDPRLGYVFKPAEDGGYKFTVTDAADLSVIVYGENDASGRENVVGAPGEDGTTAEVEAGKEYLVYAVAMQPGVTRPEKATLSIEKVLPYKITVNAPQGCAISVNKVSEYGELSADLTEAYAGQRLLVKLTQDEQNTLTLVTDPEVQVVEMDEQSFVTLPDQDYLKAPEGMKNSYFMLTMPKSELTLSTEVFRNTLANWSISLDGTIGVNYYCKLDEFIDRVVLTGPNGDVEYDREALNDAKISPMVPTEYAGQYKLTYNVYTTQMSEKIGIHAYDIDDNGTEHEVILENANGQKLADDFGLSVYDYPEVSGTELQNLDESGIALNELVHALKDLGKAAENKFLGASNEIGDIYIDTDLGHYLPKAPQSLKGYSMSLILNDVTSLRIYVPDDVESCCFDGVEYGGTEGREFNVTKGGRRYVEAKNIPATYLDQFYTYEDATAGEIQVCALSYVGLVMANSENRTPLRDLAKAFFKYYEYANNYFDNYYRG